MTGKEKMDTELQDKEAFGTSSQEEDLDSIMQELESLDQEQDASPAPESSPAPVAARPAAPAPSRERDPDPVPLRASASANSSRRATKPVGSAAQSLTLELTGTLNLKLGFTTGNRSVELICTDEALVCRFGDGTEVRIPTENPRATTLRKTA